MTNMAKGDELANSPDEAHSSAQVRITNNLLAELGAVMKPSHDAYAWKLNVTACANRMDAAVKEQLRNRAIDYPGPENKKARRGIEEHIDRERALIRTTEKMLINKLKDIQKLDQNEQREVLDILSRQCQHQVNLLGETRLKDITVPDVKTLGQIRPTPSPSIVLNLEEAYERGKFERREHADLPIADISGQSGRNALMMDAELQPLAGETIEDVHRVAAEYRDPQSVLGPRAAQVQQAVMTIWKTNKDASGAVTITIEELADQLYDRTQDGRHHSDNYAMIRTCVQQMHRTNLLPRNETLKAEGAAFIFTYVAEAGAEMTERASANWTAIKFRPGDLLDGVVRSDPTMLMPADPRLNRIDARRQRPELLLSKWLNREWRKNWKQSPGVIDRRLRLVLTAGMGLDDREADRPSIKTLDRLDAALEYLKGQGHIRDFSMESAVTDIRNELAADTGLRMNRRRWQTILQTKVTIEAPHTFHKALENYGAKQIAEGDPLIRDTHKMLQSTNRSQATLAEALNIPPRNLSRYLAGAVRVPDALRNRWQQELDRANSPQLSLDVTPPKAP